MCDSDSTICVNLVPSYKCICKIGYTTMYYSDSTPDAYNCKGTGVKKYLFSVCWQDPITLDLPLLVGRSVQF